ncbi:MAG: branched-chain amino acid ABC transporter permease [Ruminococcus sp.]|uniref:branched-chain amino acid ABC transporter permease n=1 Tax=Ruminococcus sp. TaxID=41978 RepID=UPI002873314B|nr:branched-chain amino acid ABC transporter permease [Ruminococcus sp.]MBQ3284347.1 branched-chain amino acid ABC transporter permease [Ruminococcus sp.]
MYFIQTLINGLLLGGYYALIGIGMTMILGIVKLTNLAHGEFVIIGAYMASVITTGLGIDPILSLVITVPLMFLIGFVLQYVLIGNAMKKGPEPALLVTFGLSIILMDAMRLTFTVNERSIATSYSTKTFTVLGINISVLNLVLFAISIVSILLLSLFLNRTYVGRAIRATADDAEAAALSGVNIKKVYAIAMGVSMASAAVAGLCVGMKSTFNPTSGGAYLSTAFVVVVIGGMGSIPGTLIAGVIFGLAQVIGGASYGQLISYVMLLLVLVIRPKGILGK